MMGKNKLLKKVGLGKVGCICYHLEETVSSDTVSGKTGGKHLERSGAMKADPAWRDDA